MGGIFSWLQNANATEKTKDIESCDETAAFKCPKCNETSTFNIRIPKDSGCESNTSISEIENIHVDIIPVPGDDRRRHYNADCHTFTSIVIQQEPTFNLRTGITDQSQQTSLVPNIGTSELTQTKEAATTTTFGIETEIEERGHVPDKNGLSNEHEELRRVPSVTLESVAEDRDGALKDLEEERQRNESLRQELENRTKTQDRLENDLSSTREEVQSLRQALLNTQQPKKRGVVMRLRSERSGMGKSMVDMITKELTRYLQGKLDRDNISLTIKPSQATEATHGLLVVLCLNMSRVGTNIQTALEGVKVTRDVTVLVLHHTNKENLPSLTPTSLRVSGAELRRVGEILDMAFSSDGGLYECDLNFFTVDKLATLLRKY